ncbi:hypothetical protein GCM10009800_43760 [Nocardiopsis rhodophaea]
MGPGCRSQWRAAPFTIEDIESATAEHWMMAEKARLLGDGATADRIVAAASPGEAKQLGRSVCGFDEDQRRAHRFEIVVRGRWRSSALTRSCASATALLRRGRSACRQSCSTGIV